MPGDHGEPGDPGDLGPKGQPGCKGLKGETKTASMNCDIRRRCQGFCDGH